MINYSNVSVLYVSQKDGEPLNKGFLPVNDDFASGPLASVEQALEKVFQMRCSGNFRPLSIQLLDDEYFIDKTIELDYNTICDKYYDNECLRAITIESYGNKRCKIVGGRKISGFKKDEFNGHKCVSVFLPEVKSGEWAFTDLYVGGKRADLTRYPEEGTLRCVDTENNEGELFTHSKWFIAKKEDLESITNVEDAIVSYYHYWIDEHTPVESYDRETGKLVMKYRSRYLISNQYEEDNETNGQHNTANLEYYLENIAEAFSKPNQWYLSRATGMLYYIPEDENQNPEDLCIYAPIVDKIVDVCGKPDFKVRNIRFRNIDFVCSEGEYESTSHDIHKEPSEDDSYASDCQSVSEAYGAVNFKHAKNCTIENCGFLNLGIQALSIDRGCSDFRIENCEILDIGAGGIRIYGGECGSAVEDETHHIFVRNCKISNCGRRYAAGCGILANHVHDCEFENNEISYLDYSGISVGWIWGYADSNTYDNIIRGNHIHHIGMGNLSDMGGIYLLGKQRGTIVSGNCIHDVICKHYGGWGIYTDEGSSYMTIENNIVYNCSSECYHQHYGSDNVITNNIFAFGKKAVVRCSIDELHTCAVFERNVFITNEKPIYSSSNFDCGLNSAVASQNNVIYDEVGTVPCIFKCKGKKYELTKVQNLGLESGSITVNPNISDDFKLLDDSVVFKIGFKTIK